MIRCKISGTHVLQSFEECPMYQSISYADEEFIQVDIHLNSDTKKELGIMLMCPDFHPPLLNTTMDDIPLPSIIKINPNCMFRDKVRLGDVLVAVDGRSIRRLMNIPEIISKKQKEGQLKLTFVRKNEHINITTNDQEVVRKVETQNMKRDNSECTTLQNIDVVVGTVEISSLKLVHNVYDIVIDTYLPPGTLGMILATMQQHENVEVLAVEDSSILVNLGVEYKDHILAVDDVRINKNIDVQALLKSKSKNRVRKVTFGKRLFRNKVYSFEVKNIRFSMEGYRNFELYLPQGRLGIDLQASHSGVWVNAVLPNSMLYGIIEINDRILAVEGMSWQQVDVVNFLRLNMFNRVRKIIIAKPESRVKSSDECFCTCPNAICDDKCACKLRCSTCSNMCQCLIKTGRCDNSYTKLQGNVSDSDDHDSSESMPWILAQSQVKGLRKSLPTCAKNSANLSIQEVIDCIGIGNCDFVPFQPSVPFVTTNINESGHNRKSAPRKRQFLYSNQGPYSALMTE